jgi:hypothetical protein
MPTRQPTGSTPGVPGHGEVRPLPFEAVVVGTVWLDRVLAIALGDGTVRFVTALDGAESIVSAALHQGPVLCCAAHPDGRSLLTGGDDGRLVRSEPDGAGSELASFGSRWVDHVVASAASGVIVAAVGREACVLRAKEAGVLRRFASPSTPGGLALDGKGRRLAIAHYGGITVRWVLSDDAAPIALEWRGSHLAVTWSPDGRFLVTAMQEKSLHGWRVSDRASMQMPGYPRRVRSFSWSTTGHWLATSGADRVICWPFSGRNGPMGRPAMEMGWGDRPVTRVAWHPKSNVIAAGYDDGRICLLRPEDDVQVPVTDGNGTPVTALAWSPDGRMLAFGNEGGAAGIFNLC